jgi:hypothetical protein
VLHSKIHIGAQRFKKEKIVTIIALCDISTICIYKCCATLEKPDMTKKTIIILLILISIKTYSQKCKTDKDPFTNEKITSFDFYNKTVYFEIKNDTIRFDIKFNYCGEREHEFDKGAEILIKLENGSKINLKTIKKAKPIIENIASSSNGTFFSRIWWWI